jgi:hypothetical protein
MNSSDEDDPNMKPDELTGMYTSEIDPKKGPIKLTQAQVVAQKAAAQASKSPPRSQSPMQTGSSDNDDPDGSQYVWSSSKGIFRRNKHWIDPNAPKALPAPPAQLALPAPEPKDDGKPVTRSRAVTGPSSSPQAPDSRQSTPVSSDTEDQSEMTEDQRRCARIGKKKAEASPRAPAGTRGFADGPAHFLGDARLFISPSARLAPPDPLSQSIPRFTALPIESRCTSITNFSSRSISVRVKRRSI